MSLYRGILCGSLSIHRERRWFREVSTQNLLVWDQLESFEHFSPKEVLSIIAGLIEIQDLTELHMYSYRLL